MEVIQGGVTAAKGFEAASAAAHIKYENRTDMALVYSKAPCKVAGTFTTNLVKAAPVKWDQAIVNTGKKVHVVVANSGIANACTGEEGMSYCKKTAQEVSQALHVKPGAVLMGSTGVIGKQLPMDHIANGIQMLAASKSETIEAGTSAAKAIMTTDTCEKEIAVTFPVRDKMVTIGGMAKGSGMIHPNMCTMLSFLTTDAVISKKALRKALREDIQDTYNMISVDRDTSTNDTVLLLANGMAENVKIKEGTSAYDDFVAALHLINEYLARKIAGDGEGATALFEMKVVHAETKHQAATLAKSVVCSNLTKTAIAGHDANWGRLLCAMGYAGVQFDQEKVDLYFESKVGKITIMKNGVAIEFDEAFATKILSEEEVTAIADLNAGGKEATAWGCDLTHGYIEINADYRS